MRIFLLYSLSAPYFGNSFKIWGIINSNEIFDKRHSRLVYFKKISNITWACHVKSRMHFLARVRNFATKYSTLVFAMSWDERRGRSCESRAPRSSVRNTTSANNGYIAWAERLLLCEWRQFLSRLCVPVAWWRVFSSPRTRISCCSSRY